MVMVLFSEPACADVRVETDETNEEVGGGDVADGIDNGS
jgi:hypothetical protein